MLRCLSLKSTSPLGLHVRLLDPPPSGFVCVREGVALRMRMTEEIVNKVEADRVRLFAAIVMGGYENFKHLRSLE